MMNPMKQCLGPAALTGGLTFLCFLNAIGIPTAILAAAAIYFSGVTPESSFFPRAWYGSNLFTGLYTMYCSEKVGYKFLRTTMHPRQKVPHSDYRHGVRSLSGPLDPPMESGIGKGTPSSEFYTRGGGVVDLAKLGEKWQEDQSGGVVIVPVPLHSDNYAYLILSFQTQRCVAVDPADPNMLLYMLRVVRYLTKVDFMLTDILTTHKHWDHAGGNFELQQRALLQEGADKELLNVSLNIYGSIHDKPHACTSYVDNNEVLNVADGGVKVTVLQSPGHTTGSVLFLAADARNIDTPQRLALFTGDCIFSGGCGAMFEVSSIDEVLQTVDLFRCDKVRTHPVTQQVLDAKDVLCYVGHEYTVRILEEVVKIIASNLATPGIASLESGKKYYNVVNEALVKARRLRGIQIPDDITKTGTLSIEGINGPLILPACSVPSTLAIEKKINSLLTVQRSTLEALREKQYPTNSLCGIIYGTLERDVE